MQLPTKDLEKKLFDSGNDHIIAIDEVGKGCLAGPVVVCATVFSKDFFEKDHENLKDVRDSKLLSANQRERLNNVLCEEKINFEITQSDPQTIDLLNIHGATMQTMFQAVSNIVARLNLEEKKVVVLVDGPHKIKNIRFEQIPVIKGDSKVFAIACASILAKVYRDQLMTELAQKYPEYGFEKHKGYGTKIHLDNLSKFGPCILHRKSFAPVAKML